MVLTRDVLPLQVESNVSLCIFDKDQVEVVSAQARKAGKKAKVHLKVDTGESLLWSRQSRKILLYF